MKMIIVALALVAIAVAAPVENEPPKIIRSNFEQDPKGGYVFSFESEDGIQRVENGDIKEVIDEENKPHPVVVVRGSFTYLNQEGKPITITYFADESGFHAEGESIPKIPVRR